MSGHARDLALVNQVLEGRSQARELFLERMGCVGRILAVLNARMGRPLNDHELADLVQETLLQVWRKLGTYSGRASLETWIHGFCSLELLSFLRKRARQPRAMSDVPESEQPDPPVAPTTATSDDDGLQRWLRHLAAREAQIVRLHHLEQLEYAQIGELLGISTSSVKTHYYRALEKLRVVARADGRSSLEETP